MTPQYSSLWTNAGIYNNMRMREGFGIPDFTAEEVLAVIQEVAEEVSVGIPAEVVEAEVFLVIVVVEVFSVIVELMEQQVQPVQPVLMVLPAHREQRVHLDHPEQRVQLVRQGLLAIY